MTYTAIVRYPKNELENEFSQGKTATEAEQKAIEESAVNCFRTVEVVDERERTVKGPYPLRAKRS